MTQIRRMTIDGFRGVPGRISIDFCSPKTDEALSAIILGDNGTGKSTIVDAIELALQGTYRRSKSLTSNALPSLLNLNGPAAISYIEVSFDNDTSVSSTIRAAESGGLHGEPHCHPEFKLAPIALRRKDILTFLETPEEQRQLIFHDFFRYATAAPSLPDSEETRALKETQLRIKTDRRSLLNRIAEQIGIPSESVPKKPEDIEEFVRQHVYNGLTRSQRKAIEYQGQQLHLNPYLVALAKELTRTSDELRECQRAIKRAKSSLRTPRPVVQKHLAAFFAAAQDEISTWFLRISTARSFVHQVILVPGEMSEMSLSVKLELINGQVCTPHNILSEANLDLIALLLFLAIAKEASKRGQAPVLILDDVLQSVDASIRVAFAEFLLAEFKGWQVIITVHDRLWHNQLREIFRKTGHAFVEHVLSRWTFQTGFVLQEPGIDLDQRLESAIQSADIHGMCGIAGLLLESLCDRLSVTLEVSVVRRREDKYTLGDLWPGVSKKIKKLTLKNEASDVDKWIHLRNLVGAHFNEWAQSLSVSEAEQFALATLSLYRKVRCPKCKTWLEQTGREHWQCRCGKIDLQPS